MSTNTPKLIAMIDESFGLSFESEKKYIITLQGCSTSGKTTLAHCLGEILEESGICKPFIFSTDDFYKSDPEYKTNTSYDYDNPGALDWLLMFESLKSLIDGKDEIVYSEYDFKQGKRKDISLKNKGYNLIIVEGIFAHSLFSEETFNFTVFDPSNTQKIIKGKDMRAKNDFYSYFRENAKILPISLDLDNETIVTNRIRVDRTRTGRSKQESEEYTRTNVLRSVDAWVRTTFLEHAFKVNREEVPELILETICYISRFFGVGKKEKDIRNFFSDFLMGTKAVFK